MNYANTIFRIFKYELIKIVSFLLIFAISLLYVLNETNKIYESGKNKKVMYNNIQDIGFKKDLKETERN
jgi:hypothetical protein